MLGMPNDEAQPLFFPEPADPRMTIAPSVCAELGQIDARRSTRQCQKQFTRTG